MGVVVGEVGFDDLGPCFLGSVCVSEMRLGVRYVGGGGMADGGLSEGLNGVVLRNGPVKVEDEGHCE